MTDLWVNEAEFRNESHLVADLYGKKNAYNNGNSVNIGSRIELTIVWSFVAQRIVKNRSHTFSAFLFLFLEIREQKKKKTLSMPSAH